MKEKTTLMDGLAIDRALFRVSHEIVERNKGVKDVVLIGILTRGLPMAEIIRGNIAKIEGVELPIGSIDITLYRDDLTEITDMPKVKSADVDFDVKDKHVVLCDDVLFTGRTARAAMEGVLKLGRPKTIQFAALIDRGHRELPIRADYVGKNIPTSLEEVVSVRFIPTDGEQSAKLFASEK
ncbi:MAG: bifunctional pyr operon transcriptional regulator/uracil phosphoribosyltransferase PyrR [Clostridia bacterium]|nr:bifunctional pyr operon transcriptional regulator/uracil phosphoribosyltransferase PyrR [Clostridia bacterium]